MRGTLSFILKAEELSMTRAPDFPAIGAYFSDTDPPALKKAKSTFEKSNFSIGSTSIVSSSPNETCLPGDLDEASA